MPPRTLTPDESERLARLKVDYEIAVGNAQALLRTYGATSKEFSAAHAWANAIEHEIAELERK